MLSRYHRALKFILILGDLILLNLCFFLAGSLRFEDLNIQETEYYNYYTQLWIFVNLSWVLLNLIGKGLDVRRSLEARKASSRVLQILLLHIGLMLLFVVSLKGYYYSRLFIIYFYVFLGLSTLPWRFYFIHLLRYLRKKGYQSKKVILVGDGSELLKFQENLERHPEYGMKVQAVFSEHIDGAKSLESLSNYILENELDEMYCSFSRQEPRLVQWFKEADQKLVRFRIIPQLGLPHSSNLDIELLDDTPVLYRRVEPLAYLHNRWLKRFVDLFISLSVILLVMPWLVPILSILVKMSSKGPVFFKQERNGLTAKTFYIYKFRSMRINADSDHRQASSDDPRITSLGRFLRNHHLDELPQLVNVLLGDMSLVGPRPHMVNHTAHYKDLIDTYMLRHLAQPGITGLAQVQGFRGETPELEDMQNRVKADVYYIENWSFLLDLKILLKTVWIALKGD